jgi:hypothetical protein
MTWILWQVKFGDFTLFGSLSIHQDIQMTYNSHADQTLFFIMLRRAHPLGCNTRGRTRQPKGRV